MAEDRALFYEKLRTSESRRKALHNFVSTFAILGLVVVGVFVFVSYERRKDEAVRVQLMHEREKERQRVEREVHEREARERKMAEEKERREQELRARQEAEAKYQKMIDTILENGQLYWRARLKWKQNAVGD